jgi:hypothetical protein
MKWSPAAPLEGGERGVSKKELLHWGYRGIPFVPVVLRGNSPAPIRTLGVNDCPPLGGILFPSSVFTGLNSDYRLEFILSPPEDLNHRAAIVVVAGSEL